MSESKAMQTAESKTPVVVNDTGMFANLLDTNRFKQMYAIAKLFAASELVPQQYQGHPANCMVALQMAFRMQVDPMMFMQNTYIVHGRPGIEAKLAIALVNSRGPFTGPIQWKLEGSGKNRKCKAFATHKITEQVCEAEVTWTMVEAEGWDKKQGSKWKTIPDLMFQYRSAMFLARLYCPEVLLGMHSVDELTDIEPLDVTPQQSLADQVRISTDETEEIDKIAEELAEAKQETQTEQEPVAEQDKQEATQPEPSKDGKQTPQKLFYERLAHVCDGDEGAMKDLLHTFTKNKGLELNMIPDFEDSSITKLMGQLEDHLANGQEANHA